MRFRIPTSLVLSSLAIFLAGPAFTQDAATSAGYLEEIVVTAQKREQSLQDVGISVTSFSGERLANLSVNNSNDIVHQVPGLAIQNVGGEGNVTSLYMRGIGIGDFNDHQESPVAVYNDEVYDAYMGATTTELFDQERVEVLRGPQGTLFGRNAAAGLIHYISKRPTPEFEGYGDLSIAENDHVRFEGAISGPITESLSARLSTFYNNHDPYVRNLSGPDGNDADTRAVRGQLLFQPADRLDILAKLAYSEFDTAPWYFEAVPAYIDPADGFAKQVPPDQNVWAGVFGFPSCNGCDAFGFNDRADGDPFTVNMDGDPGPGARGKAGTGLARDSILGSIKIDWELPGGATLTSITAFVEHNKYFSQDSDGTPVEAVTFATDVNAKQFSQELRIAGETDRTRWVTGLYYLDYETDTVLDVGFLEPSAFFSDQEVLTENWSVFGQVEYDFAADWTVIAGLRYLHEEKEMHASGTTFGAFAAFDPSISPFARLKEDDVAAKLQANWHLNDQTLVYAGVSRGIKAGSFNAVFGAPANFENIPVKRETPIVYEGGIKATLFDGRAQSSTSVYYYDYQDFQAFAYLALSSVLLNRQAYVYGVDSELRFSPTENFDFNFGINIMDTKIKDIENAGGVVADRDLANAPTVQFNALLRYTWPLWGGTMAAEADVTYQDDVYYQVFNDPIGKIDSYAVGNARLAYTASDERWTLGIFAKNITDEEYVTSVANNASFGLAQYFYGRPRWVGAQMTYRWN